MTDKSKLSGAALLKALAEQRERQGKATRERMAAMTEAQKKAYWDKVKPPPTAT